MFAEKSVWKHMWTRKYHERIKKNSCDLKIQKEETQNVFNNVTEKEL